ncbi:MAG: argininosuccinate synthase [Bdellovibrionales bacterium]|nr:argininosuccinate synthase [Bdellovibrionales bacterium]
MKRIVLSFSGGLDTTAIVLWLKKTYNADVIAYCCDVGNLPSEKTLRDRAMSLGASDFIFEDLKDEFAKDFVFPLLRSGALYQGEYLLGTAIARPLIAERVAHFAKKSGASAVAHGATGKGNDQIRFERAWAYLAPELEVIAPWKEWEYKGRQDLINYLKEHKIDYAGEVNPRYSVDANLFHNSSEGGILEDISKPYDDQEIFQFLKPNGKTSTDTLSISIDFDKGYPVGLNGKKMAPAELLQKLNEIGGAYGIGLVDLVEERVTGVKSRGIYETPGGTLIQKGLNSMKQICWTRDVHNTSLTLAHTYANLVYDGLWHSDARTNLEGYFTEAAKKLTGTVGMRLAPGQVLITHRSSPFSLYSEKIVSFEEDTYGLNRAAKDWSRVLTFAQWQSGLVNKENRGSAGETHRELGGRPQ